MSTDVSAAIPSSESQTYQRCAYIVPRKNRSYAWVVQNINIKDIPNEEEKFEDLTKEISEVSLTVETEYEKIKSEIMVEYEEAEIVENDLKKEKIGKIKHLKQISSIIGHLMKNKLLQNDPSKAVFELGVGRGQLAFYMASQAPEIKYVLVDYSGIKHKADNKVKNKNAVDIKRIRCPIEHVDASKIPSLTSSSSVSTVCKHFCGSATDYGINCITNAMSNNVPINGFCLAP
uniref:tRNA:m(4)X modification enzyme TRM13 n=1 Tax=Panagrolaimus sp. ES5 TaxID=591445 RepID=A0AC34GD50_9BILA